MALSLKSWRNIIDGTFRAMMRDAQKHGLWFWGINGAAGVFAAISAVAVSLALGIAATLILGALCYFLLIPVALALVQPKILVQPKAVTLPKKNRLASLVRQRQMTGDESQ